MWSSVEEKPNLADFKMVLDKFVHGITGYGSCSTGAQLSDTGDTFQSHVSM